MANVNDPRGLRLFQLEGKTVRGRDYSKAASIIYEGALVERLADGTVQEATAASSNQIVGVAAHYAAAADATVNVIDDPEATFVIETSNGSFALADKGQNVDIAVGTPDTDLRRSGMTADIGTLATTATLPLKIIDLAPAINQDDNDAGAANADILVKLNDVERGAGQAGI